MLRRWRQNWRRVSLSVAILLVNCANDTDALLLLRARRRRRCRRHRMGWSSWNCFGGAQSQEKMVSVAQAIASTGLRDLGYVNLAIDGGWLGATCRGELYFKAQTDVGSRPRRRLCRVAGHVQIVHRTWTTRRWLGIVHARRPARARQRRPPRLELHKPERVLPMGPPTACTVAAMDPWHPLACTQVFEWHQTASAVHRISIR